MKKQRPRSKKPASLGDLSEIEIFTLLSRLKQNELISRIASGHYLLDESAEPPKWLTEWEQKIKVAPLFSIDEGDCIEGVAFVISDLAAGTFWLGVVGGLEEIVDSLELIKVDTEGTNITAEDIFPVWTRLLSYEHTDLLDDIFVGNFEVYDKNLMPAKHLKKFKLAVKNYSKRVGSTSGFKSSSEMEQVQIRI